MHLISTRTHGILDYTIGLVLILAPWLLQFPAAGAQTWIPVIMGIGIILYSLLTNYELGAARAISMPGHLWMDGIGGLFLGISPWLFGFAEIVYLPHLIIGILEVGAAAMTDPTPSAKVNEEPVV